MALLLHASPGSSLSKYFNLKKLDSRPRTPLIPRKHICSDFCFERENSDFRHGVRQAVRQNGRFFCTQDGERSFGRLEFAVCAVRRVAGTAKFVDYSEVREESRCASQYMTRSKLYELSERITVGNDNSFVLSTNPESSLLFIFSLRFY